nr:DUF748 domain-containing protein [Nitrosospira briensis]
MLFEHLVISNAAISLSDFSGEKPVDTVLSPINMVLTGLSAIPDQEGQYVLQAKSGSGSSLAWKGNITLYPLASSGHLALHELKLADIWQFFREKLQIAKPLGEMGIKASYDFSYKQEKASLDLSKIAVRLYDLAVTQTDCRQPMIELRNVHIDDARFSLSDREITIPVFGLSDGRASASRASDGQMSWQSALKKPPATVDPGTDSRSDHASDSDLTGRHILPWKMHIEHVDLKNVALAYADHTLSPPLAFRVGNLGSKFTLDVSNVMEAPQVAAQAVQLSIEDVAILSVSSDAAPLATLGTFELSGGSLNTETQNIMAESINVSGGGITLTRGFDGPDGLLRLVAVEGPKKIRNPILPWNPPSQKAWGAPGNTGLAPWN